MENKFYREALKRGKKAKRHLSVGNKSPFLPALEDILSNEKMNSGNMLGIVEIPADFIVGTRTAGRTNSFASNFMPIMDESTEFATKWKNLCKAHLNEGIREPVKVYEYMNRFYVEEGNKRVSVLKFFGAASVPAQVIRILPERSAEKNVKIYYEFLAFYHCTKINYIEFSKPGYYLKLQKLVGKKPDEKWTEDECSVFRANYYYFKHLFEKMGGANLYCTVGDAFYVYIDIFGYVSFKEKSALQIKSEITKIWKEFQILAEKTAIDLKLTPEEPHKFNFIEKMFSDEIDVLKVAFVHDKTPEESGWTYSHELGRMHVEKAFENKIITKAYYSAMKAPDEVIKKAISDGNEIIFTTSPQLLKASLIAAVKYPEKMIFNCSLNKPHRYVSTYYARMYEAKFLIGAIAGVLTDNDKVGYLCDYPIYGQIAGINAFACGVQMVNPKAKVYLEWSCINGVENALERLKRRDICLISSQDMSKISNDDRSPYGLFFCVGDEQVNLAMPVWHWGVYYEKFIQGYINRTLQWESDRTNKALNYYWGLSSGVIEMIYSKNIPTSVKKLVELLKQSVSAGGYNPFVGPIGTQDHRIIDPEAKGLRYEEIITMDWLLDNIHGGIPQYGQLNRQGQATVESAGLFY